MQEIGIVSCFSFKHSCNPKRLQTTLRSAKLLALALKNIK